MCLHRVSSQLQDSGACGFTVRLRSQLERMEEMEEELQATVGCSRVARRERKTTWKSIRKMNKIKRRLGAHRS